MSNYFNKPERDPYNVLRMFPRWLQIISIATAISGAFILYVYIFNRFDLASYIRYLFLFAVSFVFSSALFLIILRQAEILRAERQRLVALFNQVSDGIIILNHEDKVIDLNQRAKDLIDIKPGDTFDVFSQVCQTDSCPKVCEQEKCFNAQEEVPYYEMQLTLKNGHSIPVAVSTTRFLDENQSPLQYYPCVT